VRYIDANPVKSGIVQWSGDYELGSARAYLGGSGPRWLSRAWVEAEACRASGAERFTPAAYWAAFDSRDSRELAEISEFLDARIRSTATRDPLEDLIESTPHRIRAWMQRKAKLADGHRVGVPVCGRLALRRALDENVAQHGTWMVEDGRKTWRGAEIAWHGLLHDMCGFSWQEIAQLADGSVSRARRLGAAHWRFLDVDLSYARRAGDVGHAAISRCLGRGGGPA